MPFACKNSLCSSRTFNNCSICHRTFFDKASLMQYSQQKRDTCKHCERSSTEFKPNWYLNSAQNNPKDLHHAACTGNFQLVAEFMRTEFSDQPGKSHLSRSKLQYGYTPIHCAAFGGHYDCLKLMLSHPDGKPNITDPEDGRTPVHLACWKGHADCLKLLLSKGGNLYLRDHNRDTPISLARDYACLSIILLHLADYLAASEEASQKPVLKAMELVWIRLRSEYGVIPDLESCDFEEIDKAPLVCYAEIPEPEEARNLQSKGKIPEEHALECLPKVEESLDSWLHFEEVVLKCRERADFPPCVQKDKLKQMIDVDETFEGMLDFYHNRGLIILPGKLITAENQSSEINDLVVVKPQYLVDLITTLSKEPNLLVFAQRYHHLSKKLLDKCIADIERERICRDLASPVSEIVRSLEEFNLLCPISKLQQVTEPKSHGEGHDIGTGIGKRECLKRKWKKLCEENWRGICDSDKVLVFDFYRPLPPSLFQYFIDRIAVESKRSYGMRPIKSKEMAIFSFGDSFFFLAETCPKFNQININARYKNGKKLHELFTTLMTIMSEICQHQFSSLKFGFGPICPIKQCPGISYQGKDLKSNSSSEVSDDELDGNSTCDDWADDSLVLGGREIRPHVICIDPAESSRPLWCNSTPIHEFEAIKEWLITPHDSEGSPCYSISRCCQIFLAKTAKDWKFLGRYLGVNDKIIDNICTENDSEDERAYQVLRSWLHLKPGHEATVQMLMKALEENGDVKTKEAFERHLIFPLLLQANQNQSSIVPSPTVTAQPSSSSPSPTQLTDSNQSVTTTSEDATEETGVFFLKWELWQLVSLGGLVFVVILLIVILVLCVRNRKLKKELTREKRNAREQQEHLQQQVPSRAAFSIIAASSAEELATILQNERKGQIEQFFRRTDGKDRKGDRFHSYTYSAGTSPKLVDMLRGPQLAALQQHRQSAKTQFQLLSQDSESGTTRDYRKTNLRSGSSQSLEPAKQDNKTKESSAKSKKSRNKILSGPSAVSPEEKCKSSDSVDNKLTAKKRQRASVSFAEPHRSSSPEPRDDASLMTQEPKQTEHPSEYQKDASPYETKPNSSDDEPDYKPSIISKVQAFEQGSIKDSGEGEQDKRQEPKREPKKLKPVHFNSTATQPDDSERRKREAEIRPLGGVAKKLHVSPVRTPSVNKDTVDH